MYGEKESFVDQLTCINDILALLSIEIGNVDNRATLNMYACMAFDWINDHTVGIPSKFCSISEG